MSNVEKVSDFVKRHYRSTGLSAPVSMGRKVKLKGVRRDGCGFNTIRNVASHCQCDCACESPGDF